MSILHTVNKSPFQNNTMKSCLAICSNQDAVIFIEDGVFGAIITSPLVSEIDLLTSKGARFFALVNDVTARGLTEMIIPSVTVATYSDFVRLSIECKQIQSWY